MNIAVIGAGNIGTRHLQAILKCNESLSVYAVESWARSIEKSKEIIGEDAGKICYYNNIHALPQEIEIAIVAVSSGDRRRVVEQLLNHSTVRYMILEKVLFPYVRDYQEVGMLMRDQRYGVSAWVNCARRSWPYTSVLKGYFNKNTGISMCVRGNMWGLGCNSIHYIDLLSYLTECIEPIEVDTSALDDNIIPSKREGYVEFTGELNVRIGSNHLKLISTDGDPCGFIIDIESERIRCHITEKGSNGVNVITDVITGIQRTELFEVPFQSSLTTSVVSSLIRTGTCPLTMYDDSVKMHLPMLKAFAKKLNGGQEYCNIT